MELKAEFIFSLLVLFLFSGCASKAGWDKIAGSWVGKPQQNLLEAWGGPQAVDYRRDGGTVVSYRRVNDTPHSCCGSRETAYRAVPFGQRYCNTTFISNRHGTITGVRSEGERCYAIPPDSFWAFLAHDRLAAE